MSHTKGPWLREGRTIYTIAGTGQYAHNWFSAHVPRCPGGAGESEMDANTALIQAAPDLLAALESLLEAYLESDYSSNEAERARAVLARARGES